LDTYPISSNSLEKFYHINGDILGQQYKNYLSDYNQWDQKGHAEKWMIFPENMGANLSIDETAISNGDLYTIVTNKERGGKKGTIVAMVEGTRAEDVIKAISKIPMKVRCKVMEVTLDMANAMHVIARKCFPNAEQVIDRFHVQKLAYDALQELRIAHRWEAINEETNAMENAKLDGVKYKPKKHKNGETKREILFRSRLLLFKSPGKWSPSQKKRAAILFKLYPDIRKAFGLVHRLRMIYSKSKSIGTARLKLALWYNHVTESGFQTFNSLSASIYTHSDRILNFFNNRSTNASAESFNAKLKAFRSQFRGVGDIKFFLFRVSKIYA
jgi:transposase